MWMISGSGEENLESAGISSGPPASWISRRVPADTGMTLSATSAAGTPQLRCLLLIGPRPVGAWWRPTP
jgi:hypothetical protein